MKAGIAILTITLATLVSCNPGGTGGGSAPVGTIRDVIRESPFGFHPALVSKTGYTNKGYADAQNIGIRWTREPYVFWFKVQPDLASPTYDFSFSDTQFGRVPADMRILPIIAPQGQVDEGYCLVNSYLPVDKEKYIAFVKATVERYDGDGYNDMSGLTNPVKYWQVDNEPNTVKSGFAELQRITYTAIKEACPDCIVLIGGVAGMPPVSTYLSGFDQQFKPILDDLAGQYVDVMDFHWYGAATGDYRGAKQVYDYIRSVLNTDGFSADLPIWITEMGAYSGDPASVAWLQDYPSQTERQQALDYFKRFVYPLSFGVKKIFPAFGLIEGFKLDSGYFDFTGLIYDGWDPAGATPCDLGLGVKKLAYYTYKKMTETLEGSDWNSIWTISESGDVYIYKFMKNGKAIYAAWWDYFNDPSYTNGKTVAVSLSGLDETAVVVTEVVPKFATGAEVTDYANAFNRSRVATNNGTALISLGDSPVLVE